MLDAPVWWRRRPTERPGMSLFMLQRSRDHLCKCIVQKYTLLTEVNVPWRQFNKSYTGPKFFFHYWSTNGEVRDQGLFFWEIYTDKVVYNWNYTTYFHIFSIWTISAVIIFPIFLRIILLDFSDFETTSLKFSRFWKSFPSKYQHFLESFEWQLFWNMEICQGSNDLQPNIVTGN